VSEGLGEGKSISWASIILFLRRMEGQGVLGSWDTSKKRGHYKVYYLLMDEKEYRIHMIKTMVESMMRDFPEETREALNENV
jgi:predicted transcriptional regulator